MIWIAAVSGTATSAPTTPSRAAPTTTLPTMKNTVLVGHLFNIQRAADLSLDEGEAAVVRPGDGRFTIVATLSPQEWQTLR